MVEEVGGEEHHFVLVVVAYSFSLGSLWPPSTKVAIT